MREIDNNIGSGSDVWVYLKYIPLLDPLVVIISEIGRALARSVSDELLSLLSIAITQSRAVQSSNRRARAMRFAFRLWNVRRTGLAVVLCIAIVECECPYLVRCMRKGSTAISLEACRYSLELYVRNAEFLARGIYLLRETGHYYTTHAYYS